MNGLKFKLESSWQKALKEELKKPYIMMLSDFVEKERQKGIPIYPPEDLVFNAFFKTPYKDVKVVIMGQDPYHGKGQAEGLAFSVPVGVKQPPSLKNIFKELSSDLKIENNGNGCLEPWAKQGVLLLNATLTVSEKDPMSHHGRGWEMFTDAVIESLVNREDPVIFVLWGKSAQAKAKQIQNNPIHYILSAPHPSPFSAHTGFLGCRHFSQINNILRKLGKKEIDWKV
jgi:uracil-DNA glycosylase